MRSISGWKKGILGVLLLFLIVLVTVGRWHLRPFWPSVSSEAITAEELMSHIQFLASDELEGRLSGSPGAEKAGYYLADQFERLNLVPVGDQGSYFQEFSFSSGVKLGESNQLKIFQVATDLTPGKIAKSSLRLGVDFTPVSFSLGGFFEGPVEFVGYGISAPDLGYDDYANSEVKGKFVFVLRYGPEGDQPHGKYGRYHALRYKARTAREKGAKGIIFIDDSQEFVRSSLSKLRFDQSFADSGIAALAMSREAAGLILNWAGQNLEDLERSFQEQKGNSAQIPTIYLKFQCDLIKEESVAKNVVGLLKGTGSLSKEIVVLGAHYDHLGLGTQGSLSAKPGEQIHNGADDNASGTAGLLEVAGAFVSRRDGLRRSILFLAFSGEEQGLLGSSHYVKDPIFPLQQTVAMINMDMIGRMKDKKLIVGGIASSPAWQDVLAQVNEVSELELKFKEGGFGPSDHSSFFGKKIPVLFFFTGVHPDYHKPSDDYDKINAAGTQSVVDFIFQTTKAISLMEQRPTFQKTKGTDRQLSRKGFQVTLGILPDYSEEVNGVRLTGVREATPAAKCGLQAGDLILEWSGQKITNIYDLTYLLQEHRAGDQVEILVLRKNAHIRLTAILEGR